MKEKENLNDILRISKKVLKIVYIILISLIVYVILKITQELGIFKFLGECLGILAPLFLGIIVAWLLNPFVSFLEKKKVRRGIGTALAYVILVGCLALLINALIPLIYTQTLDLVSNFPKIFGDVKEWLVNLINKLDSNIINVKSLEQGVMDKLDSFSADLAKDLPKNIINILGTTISSIGSFLIGLIIGFFLLLHCDKIPKFFLSLVPKKFQKSTKELCVGMNKSLRGYVNGALLDALVVFVISTVVFAIIGLKAPLLFGLFCGLMNVIPFAGPYIGGAPAVIVAFSQGTGIGIAVLISIIIIQTIEGNILQTLIISKTTKLNPVTIIVGLLIFGHFFGIIGMLLSTPIIGIIKYVIMYFNKKYNISNIE